MKRNSSADNDAKIKKIKLSKLNDNEEKVYINITKYETLEKENDRHIELNSDDIIKLENLLNDSNHFLEMQISELLIKRRLPEKTMQSLRDFLLTFKQVMKKTLPLSENLSKIICPVNELNETFEYIPPKNIKFAYPLETVLLDEITSINIMIEIPKICIKPKDYLNEAYFRRRAQYLKNIMAVLYTLPKFDDFKFSIDFDVHLPNILFSYLDFKKDKIEFIIETYIEDVFKISRFTSNTNNIRKKYYQDNYKYSIPDDDESLISNSYYDSCLLKDILINKQRNYFKESLLNIAKFYDVIILIKLWLSKRKIHLCLLKDVVLSLIINLIEKNKINEQMSELEIFKIFISSLVHNDWSKEGVFYSNLVSKNILPCEYFKKNFDITFTDKSGSLNLCFDWNIYQYNFLRHEGRMAIELINSEAIDKFRQLFLDDISFPEKFDYLFQVNTECLVKIFTQSKKLAKNLMNLCGDYIKLATLKIAQILEKGLNKRISNISFIKERYIFSPNEICKYPLEKWITFGVLVNKDYAYVTEDRGPIANSDEAADFLKFWGEISEQYHHPGENVCEVVKWNCNNILERRLIIMKIVKHLLLRHFNIPNKSVLFYGQQLDGLLNSSVSQKFSTKGTIGTGEEIHDEIIRLSDSLAKILRNIADLPLPINSVQGLSPIFRYTEVIPYNIYATEYQKTYLIGNCAAPMVNLVPPYKPFYELICFLESSGKWPDDREAVKRLKSAFYIKLAPNLKIHNYLIKVYPSFIDAIPQNTSIVFRIKIGFLHEISLCKKTLLDDGKIIITENEESKKMEMRLVTLPKLTSTLHGLQQQHNTFGFVSRLCKRWLSAQLLSHHFIPEVIDLIVAYLYVSSRSQSPPCSQLSGFLQFLHLVSSYDWHLQPLVVNLNNKFNKTDIQDIETYFNNNTNSGQCMFISYPDDRFSQKWTIIKPNKLALKRLVAVAKASLSTIESLIKNNLFKIHDFKKVFRPPINDFDLIINLNCELCPRYTESIDYNKSTNKKIDQLFFNSANLMPVIDFDPVQKFISNLNDILGEYLIFFNDIHGGILIAGVWKKSAFKPIEFHEDQLEHRKLSNKKSEEGFLIPCKEKITDKINLLGKGLIIDIKFLS